MAFSSGEVLTAANLNDLNITSATLTTTATTDTELLRLEGAWSTTNRMAWISGVTTTDDGVLARIGLGTDPNGANNNDGAIVFQTTTAADTTGSTLVTAMTIADGGQVGIGTTAPLRALDVDTDLMISNGNPAYLWHMGAGNNLELYYKSAAGDTGWSGRVYMTPTATAWASMSDRRIKRDIEAHDGDLAEILNLRVRSYNFNDDAADQPARYGFITDEVPDSLGHLVTGEAGAVTIDEETGEEKPDPQGLFYTDLIPHLVGAIQEQQTQIDALTARIEALEA